MYLQFHYWANVFLRLYVQIGLMSLILRLGCLISFVVEANSREVIIILLRKLS